MVMQINAERCWEMKMQLLNRKQPDSCIVKISTNKTHFWTRSLCLKTAVQVLFLSDGIPDSWGANDYTTLQNKGLPSSFKLFTYALGSGADTTVLAQLAANHGGEIRTVTDGGNLPDTMADYYKKLADDRDINAVRWMRYSDIVSGQTLLAGCVSIDDLRTTATVKAMVAVACMDANVVLELLFL